MGDFSPINVKQANNYLASAGVLLSATGAALVSVAVVALQATIESAVRTRIVRQISFFINYIYV
jgi:hypothetical protein